MIESTAPAAAPVKGIPTGRAEYETSTVVRHLVHELRQPLSTIESVAFYLQMVLGKHDSKLNPQLERLQQSVQQTSWILSDVVHFLQIVTPCPQLVDLNELISALMSELGRGPQPWIEGRLAAEPAIVRIDVEQGRHLVRNLLLFFRNLSRPEPRVGLRTEITPREIHLEVRARAEDRSPEEIQSLFEPFSVRLPPGSGLALASARRITEAHGGRIDLHRENGGMLSLLVAFPHPA